MDKMSFGEILRQTRERKGLDLNATARRLRIRPDILQAIEETNFPAMPPRGYTRNMVNGYARYLGLNPTEITGMYLDELYAYQVDYESSRKRPTGIAMPESQSVARSMRREEARANNRRTYYESEERAAARAAAIEANKRASARSAGRSRGERLYPESRTHQARGTVLPNTSYTNFYSGPGPVGFLQANWKLIVAALAALIVLVLIVSQIMSCMRQPQAEETSVPVTGVSSSENAVIEQPKAPTSFTFEYTVASGEISWIEVYVDGQIQVGEAVEGPQTRSFTSSDTIQFITANPVPVTAKLDGETIELQADADGVVNMTWKFSDILAQWLSDHPGVKASSTTGASTTAGTDGATTGDTTASTTDAAAGSDTQATTQDASAETTAATDAATATDSAATDTTGGAEAVQEVSMQDGESGGQ